MLSKIIALNGTLIVFVCLLLSVFLLFARSSNRVANAFFAGFLLLLAADAISWVLGGPNLAESWLGALRLALVLMQMPLFLGFIVAMLFNDVKWRWLYVLHGAPFLIALVLSLQGLQFGSASPAEIGGFLLEPEVELVWLMIDVQYYVYIVAALFYLYRFRQIFQTYYSGTRSKTFHWLCALVAVSLMANVLGTIKSIAATSGTENVFQVMQLIVSLTTLTVVSGFTLSALLMPALFRSVDKNLMKVAEHFRPDGYQNNESDLKNKVDAFMQQEQPFLRQDLTLLDLATLLDIRQSALSALINTEFNETFFNFVNRYRVTYVQQILVDKPSRGITEIFYDAGFSSKSSFNTAFRKVVGTTPSAYRKSEMKKA